ncbi:aladin-like [Plakobranchus ocellatus]|uniref:Aladin-like n=1 Tax=Plakobranchus ocellatus TaxID=259542 RepID=A0AAV4B6W1_9GAST|nr:aladin-like [Plakobranchus ocellatus]
MSSLPRQCWDQLPIKFKFGGSQQSNMLFLYASLLSWDSKKLWSNLNLITQYKSAKQEAQCDDTTLPDRLNYFYARFDRDNTTTPAPLSCDEDPPFVIKEHDVRCSLGKLRDKAAGPDNIKPRLLRNCRSQLASVLCFIFNWSLETSTVPICFKRSTIILVPKKVFTFKSK